MMNVGCKFRRSSNALASCEPNKSAAKGAWQPTIVELATAVGDTGGCYCTQGMDKLIKQCAAKAKTSLVTMEIGKPDEGIHCTLSIDGFKAANGRTFIGLNAFNQDGATFYGTMSVYEAKGGKTKYYLGGFNELTEDAILHDDQDLASPEVKAEWASLPPDIKKFLVGDPVVHP
ncbi:MAG: hypothetical protein U0271_26830 [Polyangiaceae bacterium]